MLATSTGGVVDGCATTRENAWANGGTPAQALLKFVASSSPFSGFFNLGLAVTLGTGLKVATVTGLTLMVMMYMVKQPPRTGGTENAATNPVVDSL